MRGPDNAYEIRKQSALGIGLASWTPPRRFASKRESEGGEPNGCSDVSLQRTGRPGDILYTKSRAGQPRMAIKQSTNDQPCSSQPELPRSETSHAWSRPLVVLATKTKTWGGEKDRPRGHS